MSMCRESLNLFTKMGRDVVRRNFAPRITKNTICGLTREMWRYCFDDTFGPIICKLLGHKLYDAGSFGNTEWACKRCHQFIDIKEATVR